MEPTPNDFKLTGTIHAILDYSTHETATRASGLRLALHLFGKSNNDGTTAVEYYSMLLAI